MEEEKKTGGGRVEEEDEEAKQGVKLQTFKGKHKTQCKVGRAPTL